MLLLSFLVNEAYERSKLPPYRVDEDADQVPMPKYAIDLKGCMFIFLWVAFLCIVLIVYCVHTMPRKRALLRKFMEEGQSTIGDVFYPEDQTCYGLKPQYGSVTYGHPKSEVDHTYVRRSVRLYQNFSREWVPILLLPNRPYSGHPKSDIEMSYLAFERQKSAMNFLAIYSGVWFVGNVAAAVYMLLVVESNHYEDEFPRGWMWFGICVALMPVLSVGANFLMFQRFMKWMTRGDARLLQGNDRGLSSDPNSKSTKTATDTYQPMSEEHDAVQNQRSLD